MINLQVLPPSDVRPTRSAEFSLGFPVESRAHPVEADVISMVSIHTGRVAGDRTETDAACSLLFAASVSVRPPATPQALTATTIAKARAMRFMI